MIYIQTSTHTNIIAQVNGSEHWNSKQSLAFIANQKPLEIIRVAENDISEFKQNQAKYFIAGEMSELKRNDTNLLNRSLLVLDYDEITDEHKYLQSVNHLKCAYLTYPSINYGFKGVRYRLILAVSRAFTKQEYKSLIHYVNGLMPYPVDDSATQWSQVAGMPVVTSQNKDLPDYGLQLHAGLSIDVDKVLQNKPKTTSHASPTPQIQRNGKKYTGKLIDYIVAGAGLGNRNVWMAQMAGKLLYSDTSPEATYQMMLVANDNFLDQPLEEKELNTIFKSILQREATKLNGRKNKNA